MQKHKLDFDFDGLTDVLEAWEASDNTRTPTSESLITPTKFDLVAAVQRQLKFAEKAHKAEWRRPEILNDFLTSAIGRYKEFFTLIAENPGVGLAPTLAIDLVWSVISFKPTKRNKAADKYHRHTHQLSPKRYRTYSRHMTNGRFVHHDDNLNESALDEASLNAEKLYFAKYGVPYKNSMCFADQSRPGCFGDPSSRDAPGIRGGLGVATADPSSCSSRCSSGCVSGCSSGCSTACRAGCQSYCRGGLCRDQCRAACGYVCGACETKSD